MAGGEGTGICILTHSSGESYACSHLRTESTYQSAHIPQGSNHMGLTSFDSQVARALECPTPPVTGAHGRQQEVFHAAQARPVLDYSQNAGFPKRLE